MKKTAAKVKLFLFVLTMLCSFGTVVSDADAKTVAKGLSWSSWSKQSPELVKYVLAFSPKLADLIGDGSGVWVALTDIDLDKKSDVILNFKKADDCGVDGCMYAVIYSQTKQMRGFVGNTFEVTPKGVVLDGRYIN